MMFKHIDVKFLYQILLACFVLALTAACGEIQRTDDRSRGAKSVSVLDQTSRTGADATAAAPNGEPEIGEVKPDEVVAEEKVPEDSDVPDIKMLTTSVGLRNYEQINATMATVTGVPLTTVAVRDLFNNQLATSLPTDNDIRAFLGSQQVAVYKLAVSYCEALVTSPALRANVFGPFNFAGTPAASLNAAGKTAVAEALIAKFWGKDLDGLPPFQQSTAQVVALIDQLLLGKSLTTVTVTPVVVMAACAATLSSAPVTIL